VSILDYFKSKKTAVKAKDRLQIIIAQERTKAGQPDYLPLMKKEILAVIERYTKVSLDDVEIGFHSSASNSVLELNIKLPEREAEAESAAAS
jgi:cell division topological specificity factor